VIVEACSPTDQASYTYFTEGLRRRLGDHPRPSTVLTGKIMRWIDDWFYQLLVNARNIIDARRIGRAAITHLASYLGWLRALETFGLKWGHLRIINPPDGPTVGLPLGIGILLFQLLLQTKSSQARTADVAIAFETASGLSLGAWMNRLRDLLPPEQLTPDSYIISDEDGAPWTSHHYRHTYLYPALYACRASGEPFLQTFDDSPGNSIPDRCWSFNTQRRSGRSEVSKKRLWTIRKASNAEVIEHGWWCISRSSLDMPLAYLEWSIEDRACITIFCM
jgi:hypothetical protein